MKMQETKEQIIEVLEETEEIKELKQEIADKEQEIEDLEDWEMSDKEYDDFLDDIGGDIDILGIPYCMSNVLESVDEIRYNLGKNEEEDRIRAEKKEELNNELEDLKQQLEELKNE